MYNNFRIAIALWTGEEKRANTSVLVQQEKKIGFQFQSEQWRQISKNTRRDMLPLTIG